MKAVLCVSAIVVIATTATWAYKVNYATQAAVQRVADLRGAISSEREALAVLNAEWAYLNRPDRLAALVALNQSELQLEPLSPAHFGDIGMIAYPPPVEASEDVLAVSEVAE